MATVVKRKRNNITFYVHWLSFSLYRTTHTHENPLVIQFPFLVFCLRCFLRNHTYVRPLMKKRTWSKQPRTVYVLKRSVLYLRGKKARRNHGAVYLKTCYTTFFHFNYPNVWCVSVVSRCSCNCSWSSVNYQYEEHVSLVTNMEWSFIKCDER